MTTCAPSKARRVDFASRLLMPASACAFFVVILGSNAPTPLLPGYRAELGMSPLNVAFAFSAYFVGLVAVLALLARTRLTRFARMLLPFAVGLGASADLMFLAIDDDPTLLYVGRVVTGAAVALATGPAAALMLVGGGERGRAMIASVSILGGCLGLILSVCVVAWAPMPGRTIYFVHLGLCFAASAALMVALVRRRSALRLALRVPQTDVDSGPRRRWSTTVTAYAGGASGWIAGALAVGTLPVALVEAARVESLSVAALSGIVCLVAAAVTQLTLNSRGVVVPLWIGLSILTAGAIVVAAGIAYGNLWIVLAGCLLSGLGQAPSFATGLRVLSRGLGAVAQGRTASAYSCVCYSVAGVFALGAGATASFWGIRNGTIAIVGFYGLSCGVLAMLAAADMRIGQRVSAVQARLASAANPLNQPGTPVSRM